MKIVCPVANVAPALPLLASVTVQVQLLPSVVAPATLFAIVAVRSGAVTVTVSLNELFASFDSLTTPAGSTDADPPLRGFANVPVADGVAVNVTLNEEDEAIVTAPLAVHVSVELLMLQATVPEMPLIPLSAGVPYVTLVFGSESETIV